MRATLDAGERELHDLRTSLAARIAKAVDRAGSFFSFEVAEDAGRSVTYSLRCGDDRFDDFAIDDRGQELSVTPIAEGRGWRALLGVSISWRRPRARRRDFHNAQIISFLEATDRGREELAGPVQFMRLEWEALDRDGNYGGAIAHPHWQIDIGRYALRRPVAPPTLAVSADIPAGSGADGVPWLKNLHLAACGRWMERPWIDDVHPAPHVNGPDSLDQLGDWIYSACRYIHHQLNGAMGG